MAKAIAWLVVGTDDDRSQIRFLVSELKAAGISAKSTDNTPYVGHRALEIDGTKLREAIAVFKRADGADGFWTWAAEQELEKKSR